MDQEFWHQRWAENRIGFHLTDVNPNLEVHWQALLPKRDETVFVPLCGKSEDLVWLAARHDQVVGVELSEIAVRSFFSEHFYLPQVTSLTPSIHLYEFDEIQIYSGDFFSVPLTTYPLVYDRAALIALPKLMREAYVERLLSVTADGGRILLITLSYPQDQLDGPPFSVEEDEVHRLFNQCRVTLLSQNEQAERTPKAQALPYFRENVWLIEK